jgi:hypothetical protein
VKFFILDPPSTPPPPSCPTGWTEAEEYCFRVWLAFKLKEFYVSFYFSKFSFMKSRDWTGFNPINIAKL